MKSIFCKNLVEYYLALCVLRVNLRDLCGKVNHRGHEDLHGGH